MGGRSYNELVCWLIPLIGQDSDAAQKLLQPWPSAAAALAAEMAAEAAGEQDADAKDDRQVSPGGVRPAGGLPTAGRPSHLPRLGLLFLLNSPP